MLSGITKLVVTKTHIKGTLYQRMIIHVPSKVWNDSAFPFKESQKLKILVDPKNKRIVLEP